LLLFRNGELIAKFHNDTRTIESLTDFLTFYTDMKPAPTTSLVGIEEEEEEEPLPAPHFLSIEWLKNNSALWAAGLYIVCRILGLLYKILPVHLKID